MAFPRAVATGMYSSVSVPDLKKSVEEIFIPVLCGLQDEWTEAIVEGDRLKECWVRIRGYWGLVKTIVLCSGLSAVVGVARHIGKIG